MYCFLFLIDAYDFVVLLWDDFESYCYVGIIIHKLIKYLLGRIFGLETNITP